MTWSSPTWIAIEVITAIVLIALFLTGSIGVMPAVVLFALSVLGVTGWRFYSKRNPPRLPEHYCLKCGAVLMATARSCRECGSASWSTR